VRLQPDLRKESIVILNDFLVQFSVSCTDLLPPITAPASRNGRYKTGFGFAASCSCGGGLLGSGEGRRCGAHGFDLLG
jgi:hypothetical protein